MLKGRLGLETAQVPHADRHGLIWLERGKLSVEEGSLVFATAGSDDMESGLYQVPYQKVSNILLGPGTTVSHDACRLLARHGTGLLFIGSGGVRIYASMPFGADSSELARAQMRLWSDPDCRIRVTRQMYAMRMGEEYPDADLETLRGIEGKRMKEVYKNMARRYGVQWKGRRYDRENPDGDDLINTAINHASAAIRAGASVAVSATATIPQLGFIHESSAHAFALDVADLYRVSVTLPVAFGAAARKKKQQWQNIERLTRRRAGKKLRDENVIPRMIDSIKELLHVDDSGGDA